MKVSIPGQVVERTLRESSERVVVLVVREGARCVTRVLRGSRVELHYHSAVQGAVTRGRGSYAALGDDVAMTLEGYQIAARLLADAGSPPMWPRALDAGITAEKHVFVTTTWIEGEPLHQLERPLSVAALQQASASILDILVHMHGRNVAYGDLKLSNLVLRPDGGVSLIDLDTLREVQHPGVGAPSRDRTVDWCAPEQGERRETWLGSDIWALSEVLRKLWGDRLPPEWRGALAACRAPEPSSRPTAASLRAYLLGGGGELVDYAGNPVATDRVYPEAPRPSGTATERVGLGTGFETERLVGGTTERVPDPEPRSPADAPAARRAATTVARSPQTSGCLGALLSLGKAAAVAGVVGMLALCGGAYAVTLAIKNQADEDAERLLDQMKVHKTDPDKNSAGERGRLARESGDLWALHSTPRTCAVRALAMVWDQRWHTDQEWSSADFDAASAAVNEPICRDQPEAQLARGTLYAGACRRREAKGVSTTDCHLALAAMETFWKALPAGDATNWMRVEAAWQELRARSALISRFKELKNPEGDAIAAAAEARCAAAEPWLPFAPVNGPELVEECMAAAGYASNIEAYLHYADLRLATIPTESAGRRRVLAQFYAAAGTECGDARATWSRRGVLTVTGAPWCLAMGHLARRCPTDAAVAMGEGSSGDDTHSWIEVSTAIATRKGSCVQ
ncbi:hypothetical protein LBMAG42_38990 [Deltaproteobacteria bacterium]|nr:hypothetical protein LBMAG42_38990 [Deltaproteobacteria bacterium]